MSGYGLYVRTPWLFPLAASLCGKMDFYVPITCIKNGPFEGCFGPCSSLSALFRPDMAQKCDVGCTRAFVGAAPIFFALQVLHSGRFALFCCKQGGFMWVYVAVSRSDFYVFLREPPYPF